MARRSNSGEMALAASGTGHISPLTSDRNNPTRFLKGSTTTKPSNLDGAGLFALMTHPLNVLLICLPFGAASNFLDWGNVPTFWLNFFGMVPLAKILGDATEELAAGLRNDMLAGLLNATFGNVVELVLTVQTLREGLFDVVKATLLGSVLSNMLLVLGMSFFFGGIVRTGDQKKLGGSQTFDTDKETPYSAAYSNFQAEKVQHFGVLGALVNISMLLLSCLSFVIVTIFNSIAHVDGIAYLEESLLPVSRTGAIVMISAYAAYIVFQLGTHRTALAEEEEDDGGGGDDEPTLSLWTATLVLFLVTVWVAWTSEMLVGAIRGVTEAAHMSEHFIGIVLLPIIGNACEHAAAVRFAVRDKLGLSIGIAVGSSTQIALFAVPFSVIAGWVMRKPMDLNFGALNTSVMTVSVIVVLSMVVDGQSNWLQGYLLMAAYIVVAICYWHLPNELPEVA